MRKFNFIVHDRHDSVTVWLQLVRSHPLARSYLDIPLFSPLSHAFLRTEVMKELYTIASYQHGYKTCVNRQERSNWQKHKRKFLHFSSSFEFIMHMKKNVYLFLFWHLHYLFMLLRLLLNVLYSLQSPNWKTCAF